MRFRVFLFFLKKELYSGKKHSAHIFFLFFFQQTHSHLSTQVWFFFGCEPSEQRLTHFVSPLQQGRHDLFVGLSCTYIQAAKKQPPPWAAIANLFSKNIADARILLPTHGLASSLPGLRSSTFIQTDT